MLQRREIIDMSEITSIIASESQFQLIAQPSHVDT